MKIPFVCGHHVGMPSLVPSLLAGCLVLFEALFSHECCAAPRKSGALHSKPPVSNLITLRAEPPTVLQSGRGGAAGVSLLVSTSILNRSAVEAKGVSAHIVLASGLLVPLRGPKKIGMMSSGVFMASIRLPRPVASPSKVFVTCFNCRSLR
jgi:hypothetical protein